MLCDEFYNPCYGEGLVLMFDTLVVIFLIKKSALKLRAGFRVLHRDLWQNTLTSQKAMREFETRILELTKLLKEPKEHAYYEIHLREEVERTS